MNKFLLSKFFIFTLGLTASVGAEETIKDLCEPPQGPKSPFAGLQYDFKYVAEKCVSAFPRVDDWKEQGGWEGAVAKRCASIYRMRHTGVAHKESYKDACIASEREFRKKIARWPDERKPIKRVRRPVCASTFAKGPDGEQLYACSIYYSSEAYNGPAKPLSEDAIIVNN